MTRLALKFERQIKLSACAFFNSDNPIIRLQSKAVEGRRRGDVHDLKELTAGGDGDGNCYVSHVCEVGDWTVGRHCGDVEVLLV